MEQQPNPEIPVRRPRRRKRSKWQLFKETYLPLIIAGCAILLVLVFIVGSITRAVQKGQYEKQQALEASIAAAEKQAKLEQEVTTLIAESKALAITYDYEAAIAKLSTFSGDASQFPLLATQKQEYEEAMSLLELWEDNSKIPNLTFDILIAEPERLPSKDKYTQHISTETFSNILQQLYENGYVLVSLDDILDNTSPKPIMLPAGKKPIMITQKMVNYPTSLIGSINGIGIAHKLVLDADNNITSAYVDKDGFTRTGPYDLVPILEAFIYTHPDFSYKGARATLAVTGYEGIFGYRIQASAKQTLGEEKYQQEIAEARELVQALRAAGYEIACNTYGNLSYGNASDAEVQTDIAKWNAEIAPVLGVVNTFVYARNSDIVSSNTADYSGAKYEPLQQAGFTRFLTTKNKVWLKYQEDYIRQGCLVVSDNNLSKKPDLFSGIFDVSQITAVTTQ